MAEKKFKRVELPATEEERKRHATIRQTIVQEFPPVEAAGRPRAPPGIPARIRQAREAQGLTWYALAKRAGIPNANTVRDIEYGWDAQLSTVAAVAQALGLRLELMEIYDVHGNVWEWTSSQESSDRVIRGGGWNYQGEDCQASYRDWHEPGYADYYLGFRLLAVPVG